MIAAEKAANDFHSAPSKLPREINADTKEKLDASYDNVMNSCAVCLKTYWNQKKP